MSWQSPTVRTASRCASRIVNHYFPYRVVFIQSAGNDYAAISVKLDDTKLNFNEDPKFRALSGFFNMTLPEHNIWDEKEKPGTYKGVTEGYFLFLKPLSEGNHTLYYEAATNPPNPNVYAQAVTYHLNVK